MINKEKTAVIKLLKYAFITPLALMMIIAAGNAQKTGIVHVEGEWINADYKAPQSSDSVFNVATKMPQFPGGDAALFRFLNNNVHYPAVAMKNEIQGRVICQFVVTADGTISDIEVVHSVAESLDREAVRVINLMPKWEPAVSGGKPVSVKYTLPINFSLGTEKPGNLADELDGMPQFPGGDSALVSFIKENMQYPEKAKKNGIRGRVVCQLIINADGSISDVKVQRSVERSLDKEAVRLIKSMPNWIPAKQNGQAVGVRYTVSVNFKLTDD
jgi:TonB family protein